LKINGAQLIGELDCTSAPITEFRSKARLSAQINSSIGSRDVCGVLTRRAGQGWPARL
jgi:hypothetical protein